jgi:hypothetical protein
MVKAPSIDELRTQARRTYRYWPLYLLLRLREVEQHLTPAQRDELGAVLGEAALPTAPAAVVGGWDIRLLVEYGLLQGNEPLPTTPPPPTLRWLNGDCRGFVVNGTALEFSLETEQQRYCVALLRTTNQHSQTLHEAAAILNQMAFELTPQTALETARLWAALHGARPLDWEITPLMPTITPALTPTLPPRRRGRGFMRTPNS